MDADPRFPHRPTHSDFDRISEALLTNDSLADAVSFDAALDDIADVRSILYAGEQRTIMFNQLGLTVGEALWIDGFTAGVRFQQLGGNRPE